MNTPQACVLIVDDEPPIHRMIQRLLRRDGYSWISVESGQAALEAVVNNKIDIVLMDLYMPEMDGFQVAEQMKEAPQCEDLPILIFTGMDSDENHERVKESGVTGLISKTASPKDIISALKTHLQN